MTKSERYDLDAQAARGKVACTALIGLAYQNGSLILQTNQTDDHHDKKKSDHD